MSVVLAALGFGFAAMGLALMAASLAAALRAADFYGRLHAAGLAEWGFGLAFLGLAFLTDRIGHGVLLALLAGSTLLLGAAARHALADAARARGLEAALRPAPPRKQEAP